MSSLLEELLQPIAADNFCGDDGAYETEFEAAKAEAEKISENNWKVMEDSSRKLLTKKSKDMRVLGFLALSTALTKGLTPFGEVVQAYVKLVTEHWDDIHPKRQNGRSNALKWLNEERVLSLLTALSNGSGDYETLNAAAESLKLLQTFCDGKFPGGSPPFLGFFKIVKQFADHNKPREETAPAVETTTSGSESNAAPSVGGGGIGSLNSFEDCLLALQSISSYLLSQDAGNALGFRLSRLATWSGLNGNIPSEDGVTLLPPPVSGMIQAFQEMFQAGQWPELVKNAEETLPNQFLWLDLQRYACAGLKGLGGTYPACAKAVMQELAQALARCPNLIELKFNDGTPFADPMTKEWIETDVKTALGGGGGGGMPAIKKKGDVGEEQKQAFALLEEGKVQEGLNIFRTGLANDSSRKNNFDRKLLLAELCYKGNKPHISHAILEELRGQITHHDLENWDPESCLQVYRLTQKVGMALADSGTDVFGPGLKALALEAHAKISRLDPLIAFQTDPPA